MVDDGCKTEGCGEWKPKSNADKRNWAFTIMFRGTGKDDAWTREDWNFYLDNQNKLWSGKIAWKPNPDDETGWDLFALHTERLASQYNDDQEPQFVRDFALVFAGISSTNSWAEVAWDARNGHGDYPILNEGNQGLDEQYLDSLRDTDNQSHHYAGIFFLSFFATGPAGLTVNLVRDVEPNEFNPGDIRLGSVAAIDANALHGLIYGYTPADVSNWIDQLSP